MEVDEPIWAPASPSSSSWNSSENETTYGGLPKRCKISHNQLAVLFDEFEHEPLPSFDQRQLLAQRLGMTPRSVQIWFQNRRQRLKSISQKGEKPMSEPMQFRIDVSHIGLPSLSSAAAAAVLGGAHWEEVFYRLPALAQQGAPASSGTYGMAFDRTLNVIGDKFAATKALLGAGAPRPALPPTASPRGCPRASAAFGLTRAPAALAQATTHRQRCCSPRTPPGRRSSPRATCRRIPPPCLRGLCNRWPSKSRWARHRPPPSTACCCCSRALETRPTRRRLPSRPANGPSRH